ncbi:MAG: hypothetical protein C0468_04720 [Planctomyces sp.]|nr:hypothetical protein [Planctomyces sp.]
MRSGVRVPLPPLTISGLRGVGGCSRTGPAACSARRRRAPAPRRRVPTPTPAVGWRLSRPRRRIARVCRSPGPPGAERMADRPWYIGTMTRHRQGRRTLPAAAYGGLIARAALGGGLALGLGGCDSGALDRAASSGSLFGLIDTTTPAEAAAMSIDLFDPDKRARGTNLLANAPFGGEDVYLRTYAAKLGDEGLPPDPDEGVRAVAARALGLHGGPQHVPLVLPLLAEPDRRVRLEGVRALQRLHSELAVSPLIGLTVPERQAGDQTTGEAEPDIRAEACTALGQYRQPRVFQALVAALLDEQLVVQRAAQRSLETLTGQGLGDEPGPWVRWSERVGAAGVFAGAREYQYPYFRRDLYVWEYIPLVPQPPNEEGGRPAGLRPDAGTAPGEIQSGNVASGGAGG